MQTILEGTGMGLMATAPVPWAGRAAMIAWRIFKFSSSRAMQNGKLILCTRTFAPDLSYART